MAPLKKIEENGDIVNDVVSFPPTIFLMGADLKNIPQWLQIKDQEKHLSLGNLLAATPPQWVSLRSYGFARRMVSNGAYLAFLNYQEKEGHFFDNPHLWRYIWTDLNYRIESIQMPLRVGRRIVQFEEDYSHCTSFVEAYIDSIRFEIQRIFRRMDLAYDQGKSIPQVIQRLFALFFHKLRHSILLDESEYDLLSEEDRELMADYREGAQVCADIDFVVAHLKDGYLQAIDKRFVSPFKKGQHKVETITFLQRFRQEIISQEDFLAPTSLRRIFYPRLWLSPQGIQKQKDFLKRKVPWEVLPLTGISLYEALGYTIWLSHISGKQVYLPNEAEYERASSWPQQDSLDSARLEDRILLDPHKKMLFPWEKDNQKIFNYYFGREGRGVEDFYSRNGEEYKKLLEATAKKEEKGDSLYMLEGFGWHWTCDRCDEDERKYSRFRDGDYPRFLGAPCFSKDTKDKVEVFQYEANLNIKSSYFILKGSPDIVGGPGIITRRYAAYPLRGYKNVGFRFIVK